MAHGGSNVQRRLGQAQAVAYVHPAHGFGRAGLAKQRDALQQGAGAFLQAHQIGGQFAHGVECGMGLGHSFGQGLQRCLPLRGVQPVGRLAVPAPFAVGQFGRYQPPVAGALLDVLADGLPLGQAARVLQAACQQVAAEFEKMPGAKLLAQKLHANGVELVRLVKYHGVHAGQQLGHARFAHGQVGKKQVVVDDDDVCRQRLAPRVVDVAILVLRALAAQAVFACGGDDGDDGRAFFQPAQFGQVATGGGLRKALDAGQGAQPFGAVHVGVLPRQCQAVQAQVAAAPLEQCNAHGQAQELAQIGQVAREKLVLQGFGGGGNQHAFAA